jgi:hypothetical protein
LVSRINELMLGEGLKQRKLNRLRKYIGKHKDSDRLEPNKLKNELHSHRFDKILSKIESRMISQMIGDAVIIQLV